MEGALPDGIALDAEGGVWVASPISGACLRVVEGGKVTDKIEVENQAFACTLGGPDRKTLFIATAKDSHPVSSRQSRTGRIETIQVKVAGAGWP